MPKNTMTIQAYITLTNEQRKMVGLLLLSKEGEIEINSMTSGTVVIDTSDGEYTFDKEGTQLD